MNNKAFMQLRLQNVIITFLEMKIVMHPTRARNFGKENRCTLFKIPNYYLCNYFPYVKGSCV